MTLVENSDSLMSIMFGLSFGHLVIVFVVVLLFGHKRLPELGHALGRGMGAFKRGLEGHQESPNLDQHEDEVKPEV